MALTLALAKQNSRILHNDEDALIQQYLDDAIANVESWSETLLTRREVTDRHAAFGCHLPLFWGPDPSDVSVAYFDDDDVDQEITDARIVGQRLHPSDDGWPSISENSVIVVTYTAGWTTVPADLIGAVLVLVEGKTSYRDGAYDDAVRAAKDACFKHRQVFV